MSDIIEHCEGKVAHWYDLPQVDVPLTLEPMTDEPWSDGGHVILDARNVDMFRMNHYA